MPTRMLRYRSEIIERHPLSDIRQYLVYIGKSRLTMVDRIQQTGLDYHYSIIDMHKVDCRRIPGCLRSRYTFWDIQVPKTHSIFDNFLCPDRPASVATPDSLVGELSVTTPANGLTACRDALCIGPTPAPYAYRGLPALAPLSMAGSVCHVHD